MNREILVSALDFLTEGEQAVIPPELGEKRPRFLEHLRQFRARARTWTRQSNIQAFGIGAKLMAGDDTRTLALRIYVRTKCARKNVRAMIPRRLHVPGLGWIPTDVIEIGKLRPQSFTGRVRPARPGISVGHLDGDAGTLGCVVRHRSNPGHLFILGNSHVLAVSGCASIGDPIYQPAPVGKRVVKNDLIGTLAAFVPFHFSNSGHPNLVDAAIALVAVNHLDPEIRLLGFQPTHIRTDLARGMPVQKVGMTTDLTTGVIDDIDVKYAAMFPRPGTGALGRVGFSRLVSCGAFTGDGDSGSAVLSSDGALVGLHFAGSESRSISMPIAPIFAALDLELP